MLAKSTIEEPATVNDALGDPKWVAATDSEHQALLRNHTWRLVPRPKGKMLLAVSGFIK